MDYEQNSIGITMKTTISILYTTVSIPYNVIKMFHPPVFFAIIYNTFLSHFVTRVGFCLQSIFVTNETPSVHLFKNQFFLFISFLLYGLFFVKFCQISVICLHVGSGEMEREKNVKSRCFQV